MSKKYVIKNIGKLYAARLLTDTEVDSTYESTRYLEGLREITVTPTAESGQIYAEGQVWDTDSEAGVTEVSLDRTDMTAEDEMFLLGKKRTSDGGVIGNRNDEAPYVALMYEKKLTNGVMEYVTLFKGKFSKLEDKVKTREGGVEYQTKTLVGQFIHNERGDMDHVVRSNSPGFDQSVHDGIWGEGNTITLPTVGLALYTDAQLREKSLVELQSIATQLEIVTPETKTYEELITTILGAQ